MNIVELAREAGFECAPDGHIFADDPDGVCDEELEHFAALVRAQALEEAIDLVAFHGGSVEIEAAIRALKEKQ